MAGAEFYSWMIKPQKIIALIVSPEFIDQDDVVGQPMEVMRWLPTHEIGVVTEHLPAI